jgi:predicted SAM-dependent methyltransferase
MDILIVLQTHSKGDSQHYLNMSTNVRYCNAPKSEIMRRCTRSLVESINYAKELFIDSNFELVVYDDHSDESAITELKNNLNIATFKTQLISLDTYGIMPSILKCYEHGRDYGKEIVYFAQDDYLYDTSAIYSMIMTMLDTSNKLNNYTCIYPYDDPYKYIPENTAVQSHIIQCQKRHWRTQVMTASCFMTHHKIIKDNWDLFEAMGKHAVTSDMEDKTINQLFRSRGYYLFTPIPSLALHMQYDTEKDPYIDWREWWDRYDRDKTLTPTTDKTVLNVGFGGSSIPDQMYTEDLTEYREISLDIDKMHNPDILADIYNISHIPDKFVDVAYSSHMIEHIHYFKVPSVIKELLRVVKDDGFVRLITPNMKTVAIRLASGKILDTVYDSPGGPVSAMDMLYGSRYHTHRHSSDYMVHKCGFTKEVFEDLAEKHNFKMTIKEVGYDLIVDIRRPA